MWISYVGWERLGRAPGADAAEGSSRRNRAPSGQGGAPSRLGTARGSGDQELDPGAGTSEPTRIAAGMLATNSAGIRPSRRAHRIWAAASRPRGPGRLHAATSSASSAGSSFGGEAAGWGALG